MANTKKQLDKNVTSEKRIQFTKMGWEDYNSWQGTPKKIKRIGELIDDALISPLHGRGKPERLSGDLKGYYSRRIDSEHRLLYKISGDGIIIVQARFHY